LIDPFFAVRTIHFASVTVFAGLLLFVMFVAEPTVRHIGPSAWPGLAQLHRRWNRIAWTTLGVAVVSGATWLVLLSARIGGQSVAEALSENTVWTVLTETRFGEYWIVRFVIAACLALLLTRFDADPGWRTRWDSATSVLLSAVLIASLAGAGHGGAGAGTAGTIQAASDAVHLVAAGGWIGGLVPFVMAIAHARRVGVAGASISAELTVRFSAIGVIFVAALVITGIVNSWFLVGSLPHLVCTAYGRLLMVKLGLFTAMVSLASINRFKLVPRLLRSAYPIDAVVRLLERNALIEIVLGFAILAIVGVLGAIPPAAHMHPT
jgi:copper resistance protein D